MKALSLIEPWASLIALGAKKIETRSWHPPEKFLGMRFAIHASKSREAIDDGTAERLFKLAGLSIPEPWPCGSIIAIATLGQYFPTEAFTPTKIEGAFGNYEPGRYAILIPEVLRLAEPIPCRGALGFWEVGGDALLHLNRIEALRP